MNYQVLNRCLCCNGINLNKYLDLGVQPLANAYRLNKDEYEEKYPLYLNVCTDCWHSQNGISVNPDILYKNYLYVSGTSISLKNYFDRLSSEIFLLMGQQKGLDILDIACNDGTFLNMFKDFGWNLYGIDPAENINKDFIQGYFPSDFKEENKFDVITALNVFGHVNNPYEFLVKCKEIIKDEGVIFIQTSQKDMVVNGEFDTVYHEHISFFSINSMMEICKRAGVFLNAVYEMDVHGNSYLFCISKDKKCSVPLHEIEEKEGRYSIDLYNKFQQKMNSIKEDFLELYSCNSIIGYGAAAKAVVMINTFGMKLEYVIDDSPLKQGRYIPGTDIKIYGRERLLEEKIDLSIIILAWNMFDEIRNKISSIRENNDKFIRIFPKVEVLNAEYV